MRPGGCDGHAGRVARREAAAIKACLAVWQGEPHAEGHTPSHLYQGGGDQAQSEAVEEHRLMLGGTKTPYPLQAMPHEAEVHVTQAAS